MKRSVSLGYRLSWVPANKLAAEIRILNATHRKLLSIGDTDNFPCLYNAKHAVEYKRETMRIKKLICRRETLKVRRFMLNLLLPFYFFSCFTRNDGVNGKKTTIVDDRYDANQTVREFKRTEGDLQFKLSNTDGVLRTCLSC